MSLFPISIILLGKTHFLGAGVWLCGKQLVFQAHGSRVQSHCIVPWGKNVSSDQSFMSEYERNPSYMCCMCVVVVCYVFMCIYFTTTTTD